MRGFDLWGHPDLLRSEGHIAAPKAVAVPHVDTVDDPNLSLRITGSRQAVTGLMTSGDLCANDNKILP